MAPPAACELSAGPSICLSVEEYPPIPGGLAVSAHRLGGFLADAGFAVHVVTPGPIGAASEIAHDSQVVVHRIQRGNTEMETRMRLHRYIQSLDSERQFDMFHGFFLPAAVPCLVPARRTKLGTRRAVIASIRGTDATTLLRHPLMRASLLQVLRQSDWITSVNQLYLDMISKDVPVDGRSSVIRNGIPPREWSWKPTAENAGIVGTSGKFRKVKDIPLLVRGVHGAGPAARRLLLVGDFFDPAEQDWTNFLIREFGFTDRVEITGMLERAQAIEQLQRMRVYVQTSAFEGMPNALLEAAAAGVPIVATAVGGIPEVFTHGVNALLVPHGDPGALARAIRNVLDNELLALELSRNARKLGDTYSRERERREWVELHLKFALPLNPTAVRG